MWVVVKIMVPFRVPSILGIRCRIIIGTQKGARNFDNHPCKIIAFMAVFGGLGLLFYILLGFRVNRETLPDATLHPT